MRTAILISLILVASIVLSGCVSSTSNQGSEAYPAPNSSESPKDLQVSGANARNFTLSEISQFNSKENCLMAIDGKVYNLTGYFGKHPAGDKTLLFGCGKDSTAIFTEKHSQKTRELLPPFYAGELSSG